MTNEAAIIGPVKLRPRRTPPLNPGEGVIVSVGGSRQDSDAIRIIGGHVTLTNQRLIHMPGIGERAFRGHIWECPLSNIQSVEVGSRFTNFIGGLGQAVTVTLKSGSGTMFQVWRGSRLVSQIRAAIDEAGVEDA